MSCCFFIEKGSFPLQISLKIKGRHIFQVEDVVHRLGNALVLHRHIPLRLLGVLPLQTEDDVPVLRDVSPTLVSRTFLMEAVK